MLTTHRLPPASDDARNRNGLDLVDYDGTGPKPRLGWLVAGALALPLLAVLVSPVGEFVAFAALCGAALLASGLILRRLQPTGETGRSAPR